MRRIGDRCVRATRRPNAPGWGRACSLRPPGRCRMPGGGSTPVMRRLPVLEVIVGYDDDPRHPPGGAPMGFVKRLGPECGR